MGNKQFKKRSKLMTNVKNIEKLKEERKETEIKKGGKCGKRDKAKNRDRYRKIETARDS